MCRGGLPLVVVWQCSAYCSKWLQAVPAAGAMLLNARGPGTTPQCPEAALDSGPRQYSAGASTAPQCPPAAPALLRNARTS